MKGLCICPDLEACMLQKVRYYAVRAWLDRRDRIRTTFSVTNQPYGSMQIGQH